MSKKEEVLQKQVDLMKAKILELSQPNVKESKLNEQTEMTSENSFGNYDDVFSDGQECADAYTALAMREVLRQVEELEKQ